MIFFVPFLGIVTDAQDATSDVWGLGKVMFIGIIGVVSWEIALISRFWTWIFIVVWALSYAITFPFLIALAALFQALKVYDSSQVCPVTKLHHSLDKADSRSICAILHFLCRSESLVLVLSSVSSYIS